MEAVCKWAGLRLLLPRLGCGLLPLAKRAQWQGSPLTGLDARASAKDYSQAWKSNAFALLDFRLAWDLRTLSTFWFLPFVRGTSVYACVTIVLQKQVTSTVRKLHRLSPGEEFCLRTNQTSSLSHTWFSWDFWTWSWCWNGLRLLGCWEGVNVFCMWGGCEFWGARRYSVKGWVASPSNAHVKS